MKDDTSRETVDSSQPFRLASGGLVDRGTKLSFKFDNRVMAGYRGDTLASALLANGTRLLARSFKYHRPRGLMTTGPEEPNALIELRMGARREPNTKATTVELYAGLEANSQNRWPSLGFDVLAINSLFGSLLGAGFYYKTFMWPPRAWEALYEPLIRRAAGLGKVSAEPDPDTYEKCWLFCDVLVIGAGPAGLMAALAAARSGARVVVCDEDFRLGGRLLFEKSHVQGKPGPVWVADLVAELAALSDVRLMPHTIVFGLYDGNTYGALERVNDHLPVPPAYEPRQKVWRIVARRAVLASGATERAIIFGGNDRPGIMMASALRGYANRFGVAAGRRTAVFTNNDSGWRTAADLASAGVEVAALIDSRPSVGSQLAATARSGGFRIIQGARVVGTRGQTQLRAIEIKSPRGEETLAVDALGVSGGWDPALSLTCHLGGKPQWDEKIAAFVPDEISGSMQVVGAANGTMSLAGALREGVEAGLRSAQAIGLAAAKVDVPDADSSAFTIMPLWHVADSKGKAFVDFQNDVTLDDVVLAHREGFRSSEHLKRYTTLGMGTDQGKTANVNALAVLASLCDNTIPNTGTTTFRPPYTPVPIAALAGAQRGKHFRPTRLTPSHQWAEEQGAVFVDAGQWVRAQYFPTDGEREWLDTVSREVNTVRTSVGICDVSTLGKIDVQGADSGVFLDRIYVNSFSSLKVGRCRYGLMLREDGMVLDDGTTSRLSATHYLMTTTTANAGRVMQHLEFCHQVLWPELDVQLVSVTEQWAQYAIAGPRARTLLTRLVDPGHVISNECFPYLSAAQVSICGGINARLFRISFCGELGYELAVPARYGDSVMRRLMLAGEHLGAAPYGTEALSVMRIEKGHPAGNELNGQTTVADIGLARLMSDKKDYIGRVMAARPALLDRGRPTLVGLKPVNNAEQFRAGTHLLALHAPLTAKSDQGYITSVAYSPTLGHWIGLGLLSRGATRIGEHVRGYDPVRSGDTELEVCSPVFVDPTGERLRA